MNDEIREIEEWLRDISTPTGLSYSGDRTLSNSMVDKIVDYITNLQNENENMKEKAKNYLDIYEEMFDYKSRVEKAVELIKTKGLKEEEWQNNFCIKATVTYTREEIFDLLNILQGENNE